MQVTADQGAQGGRFDRLGEEVEAGDPLLSRDELAERYTGVVLFARPHFRFDNRTPELREVKQKHWFWSAVLEQRFVYRDVLWAALLINAAMFGVELLAGHSQAGGFA